MNQSLRMPRSLGGVLGCKSGRILTGKRRSMKSRLSASISTTSQHHEALHQQVHLHHYQNAPGHLDLGAIWKCHGLAEVADELAIGG